MGRLNLKDRREYLHPLKLSQLEEFERLSRDPTATQELLLNALTRLLPHRHDRLVSTRIATVKRGMPLRMATTRLEVAGIELWPVVVVTDTGHLYVLSGDGTPTSSPLRGEVLWDFDPLHDEVRSLVLTGENRKVGAVLDVWVTVVRTVDGTEHLRAYHGLVVPRRAGPAGFELKPACEDGDARPWSPHEDSRLPECYFKYSVAAVKSPFWFGDTLLEHAAGFPAQLHRDSGVGGLALCTYPTDESRVLIALTHDDRVVCFDKVYGESKPMMLDEWGRGLATRRVKDKSKEDGAPGSGKVKLELAVVVDDRAMVCLSYQEARFSEVYCQGLGDFGMDVVFGANDCLLVALKNGAIATYAERPRTGSGEGTPIGDRIAQVWDHLWRKVAPAEGPWARTLAAEAWLAQMDDRQPQKAGPVKSHRTIWLRGVAGEIMSNTQTNSKEEQSASGRCQDRCRLMVVHQAASLIETAVVVILLRPLFRTTVSMWVHARVLPLQRLGLRCLAAS